MLCRRHSVYPDPEDPDGFAASSQALIASANAAKTTTAPSEQTGPKSEPTGFAEDSTTKQPRAEIKEIAKPTGPADPFDPAIFNRQMHPEKK